MVLLIFLRMYITAVYTARVGFQSKYLHSAVLVMKFLAVSFLACLLPSLNAQSGISNDPQVFGNAYNFWTKLSSGWDVRLSHFLGIVVQLHHLTSS